MEFITLSIVQLSHKSFSFATVYIFNTGWGRQWDLFYVCLEARKVVVYVHLYACSWIVNTLTWTFKTQCSPSEYILWSISWEWDTGTISVVFGATVQKLPLNPSSCWASADEITVYFIHLTGLRNRQEVWICPLFHEAQFVSVWAMVDKRNKPCIAKYCLVFMCVCNGF